MSLPRGEKLPSGGNSPIGGNSTVGGNAPFGGGLFLRGFSVNFDKLAQDSYVRQIESLRELTDFTFTKRVTLLAGENGSGKSTLLEALAVAAGFNAEGGSRSYHFSTYSTHSPLCGAISLRRGITRPKRGYFLRAESFYNVATKELEYDRNAPKDYIPELYHERSHGESFLALFERHLRGAGLYFFDEPEAALSPQSQLTLLREIFQGAERGSQFVIATHSPILLGVPDAQILLLGKGPLRECRYEDTGSYQIMRLFMQNRERLLHELLSTEDVTD